MLLQRRIDDVLEGVHLSDLLDEESVVLTRMGFGEGDGELGARSRALPVLAR